jgi:hypothetical protein
MINTSQFVRSVHQLFCIDGIELEQLKIDEAASLRLQDFREKFYHWSFCRQIKDFKRSHDLDRSYLEVREGLIQKLLRLRKENKENMKPQIAQIDHMNEMISDLIRQRDQRVEEINRMKKDPAIREKELKKGRELLCEVSEELQFRENVRLVLMELTQSKYPILTQGEEELENLEKTKDQLEKESESLAKSMSLPEELSQTLFYYTLNNGYFSHLTSSTWGSLMKSCSEKEQSWLREHYEFDDISMAWKLSDEQHYYSPLKQKQIVGHRDSSGISFLDYNIKKLLDVKLNDMTFTRYEQEVRSFYATICFEALEDGVLTHEEINMMQDLAKALSMDWEQALQVLNQEAVRVQKGFVNKNMAMFHELAMADGKMHREEAKFLVEMKSRLESEILSNLSSMLDRIGDEGIQLKMDDEMFFVEMCRLALRDQHLDECEKDILNSFGQQKGWSEEVCASLLELARAD